MKKYILLSAFSFLYLAGYMLNFAVAFAYDEKIGDENFKSLYSVETIDLISTIYSLPVGILNLLFGYPVREYWLFTALINLGIFLFIISRIYDRFKARN